MTLKLELDNPRSTLRAFFAEHLPDSKTVRRRWTQAAHGASPVTLSETMPPGLLGQASSLVLTSRFDPSPEAAVLAGCRVAQRNDLLGAATVDAFATSFAEALTTRGQELWELAVLGGWFEQLYRGGYNPNHPFASCTTGTTLEELRAMVEQAWILDLAALDALAEERLAELRSNSPPIKAVVFSGSADVGGADADVLCGSVLLEIKSSKKAELTQHDIQQLVSYALLDYDDEYGITDVAMYNSRHGILVTWPLAEILAEMAGGRSIDVAALRQLLKETLRTASSGTMRR